jgi:hypothetical protein
VNITASYTIGATTTTSNAATLTVNTTKVLQSIALQSDASSVALCATAAAPCAATSAAYPSGGYALQFHAFGTYNDGTSAGEITSSVTWSVTDTTPATGSSISAAGVLTTGSVGGTPVVVKATQGTVVSPGFNVTVDAGAVSNVTIVSFSNGAPSTSVPNGASATYEALLHTATGSYWVTRNFNWASSVMTVGTIVANGANAGTYTAVSNTGSTNVTCTRQTLTGGPIIVSDTGANPTSVVCTPGAVSVTAGSKAQLRATVTFSDSSQVDETTSTNTTWTSPTPATANFQDPGTPGLITGVATGSVTITPSYLGVTATAGNGCVVTVP